MPDNRRLLINKHPNSYYTGYARYYEAEDALRGSGNWRVGARTAQRALGHLQAIDRQKYPLLFQEMVLHRLILAHVGAGSDAATLRPLVEEFRQQFPDSPYELPDAAAQLVPAGP